ncbi:MAG TPA: phosphoribosyl-AMP cyclohydrolase, partial [Anaeromyxobacteraceae bacterium]|nr:phosphoribosyl-AMP cyclohydrolase [Anaeromyxobacteraceae bacterium]
MTAAFEGGALDALFGRVKFDARGLVPVIAQDEDGTVLMLAWANEDALKDTARTGRGTYWSRSRRARWVKGDTSGHFQHVRAIALDCDGDAVLYVVRQEGPACHLGTRSCFTEKVENRTWQTSASSPGSGRRSRAARPTAPTSRATRS